MAHFLEENVVSEIEKSYMKLNKSKVTAKSISDLDFFVETISIQGPLNINETENKNSVWSITLDFNGLQFDTKLILAQM